MRPSSILSKSDPAVKVVRTLYLVEEPFNVAIQLSDLSEVGVAKELVPGKQGIEFWKQMFRKVSSMGKTGVGG